MRSMTRIAMFAAGVVAFWVSLAPSAWAVPSYTRRYGVECASCHTVWGALTAGGVTFRLSGYRAINGVDLKPESEDIEIAHGSLVMPTTLPLSFVTGVGFDARTEKRQFAGGGDLNQSGSSIAVEDGSLFLSSPLGRRLSAFVEFPMRETRAWEFTPTGLASVTAANYAGGPHQIQFGAETPAFEVAKFFWNNIFGESSASRDSANLAFGVTHLPLAYSPGKVRLPVNQYLIYERRALDLISRVPTDQLLGAADEYLFRLSEPQGMVEMFGMVVPGGQVTDVKNRETLWLEYHVGVANGSNASGDNNTSKDLYGRIVMRKYNQSLGLFAFRSPDTYDDTLRASLATGGIGSGRQLKNSRSTYGLDFTLSLLPFGTPLWLDNQIMVNSESNPTGYDTEFKWKGGFHQLNWQPSKETMAYLRYDWIRGDHFADGVTSVEPRETDYVGGVQHLVAPNIKLIGEYRHHYFEDKVSTGNLTDDGITLRVMLGF